MSGDRRQQDKTDADSNGPSGGKQDGGGKHEGKDGDK